MKKNLFENILFITFLYIIVLFIIIFILDKLGYVFLNWFIYFNLVIISLGILVGTTKIITKNIKILKTKITLCIVFTVVELIILIPANLLFISMQDKEEFVKKNNHLMVKETHSILLSNWICYYDFENIFIRKKQERIYEAYDDSISEYLYTIYYDKKGNIIKKEIKTP